LIIPPLQTEGSKIKDSRGNPVALRGFDFIELAYEVDKLRGGATLEKRAKQFKNIGANLIRIEVNYDHWNANLNTNDDDKGNRDFIMEATEVFRRWGICVLLDFHSGKPAIFYTSPTAWADWLVENLVTPFLDNPYVVGVNIMNEPPYGQFGGVNLGGGVTSGYWEAAKIVCARVHAVNPNLLMIVHANMENERGFCPILENDPIPTPNVVYNWHFYYSYCPAFNTYHPWGSLDPDPTYEDCKLRGQPYYQSYAAGNLAQARQELEQVTYEKFLWVPNELNLPIMIDEFGFNGDELPHFSRRKCPNGHWEGQVRDTLDELGNPKKPPWTGTVYCPIDGAAIPQPAPYGEPGWPQCFEDYLSILNEHGVSWTYFGWWPKTYGGYGMVEHDMKTLSKVGRVLSNYIPTPISPIEMLIRAALSAASGIGLIFLCARAPSETT